MWLCTNRERVISSTLRDGKVSPLYILTKVTAQSDHKPIENIQRKPLLSVPKRLQRMMLRLQKYDVDVVYVPGPEMWLADTLSRAYLPESAPTGSVGAELETINMAQHLPVSEDRLSLICSATKEDNTLQTLIKTIQQCWPKNKAETPQEIGHYDLFQVQSSSSKFKEFYCHMHRQKACFPVQ